MKHIAKLLVQYRTLVLLVGIAITGAAAYFGYRDADTDFSFRPLFESSDQIPLLDEYMSAFGEDADFLMVVVRHPDGMITPERVAVLSEMVTRLETMSAVERTWALTTVDDIKGSFGGFEVAPLLPEELPTDPEELAALQAEIIGNALYTDFLINKDGTTTAVVVEMSHTHEFASGSPEIDEVELRRAETLSNVDALAADLRTRGMGLEVYLAGVPVVQRAYRTATLEDQLMFLPAVAFLLMLALFISFRNLHGVYIPLGAVAIATTWAIAFLFVTGERLNILNNIIPTLLLVYGSADAIHVIARYYDELPRHGHERLPALRATVEAMVLPCMFTSLTTAVGFASLYVARIDIIKWLGVYAAAGIVLSFIVVVALVPAGLSLHKAPKRGIRQHRTDGIIGRFLAWLVMFVTRRRRTILAVTAGVIAVAGVGTLFLKTESRMMEELHPAHEVTIANHIIEDHLSGALSYSVLLNGPEGVFLDPEVLRNIDEIGMWGKGLDQVSRTISLAEIVKEANKSFFEEDPAEYRIPDKRTLVAKYLALLDPETVDDVLIADSENPGQDITHITFRAKDMPSSKWKEMKLELEKKLAVAFPPETGIRARITGSSTLAKDALGYIVGDMFKSALMAVMFVTIFMGLLFRSVRIGLISMIPNVAPLLVTLGYMGVAGINLRTSTALIFSVALGIAVDDTIHILARYREEYLAVNDHSTAVRNALLGTGRALLFTTFILTCGFGVLSISDFTAIKQFGQLTALTFITALLADLFVTPALLLTFKPELKGKRVDTVVADPMIASNGPEPAPDADAPGNVAPPAVTPEDPEPASPGVPVAARSGR